MPETTVPKPRILKTRSIQSDAIETEMLQVFEIQQMAERIRFERTSLITLSPLLILPSRDA